MLINSGPCFSIFQHNISRTLNHLLLLNLLNMLIHLQVRSHLHLRLKLFNHHLLNYLLLNHLLNHHLLNHLLNHLPLYNLPRMSPFKYHNLNHN